MIQMSQAANFWTKYLVPADKLTSLIHNHAYYRNTRLGSSHILILDKGTLM